MIVNGVGGHSGYGIPGGGKAAERGVCPGSDALYDTWVMDGKSYKSEEGRVPEPLMGAFKKSIPTTSRTPSYVYDRNKFTVHGLGGGDGPVSVNVGLVGGDDIADVTFDFTEFRIQLANAKDGKYPVTKEEFLKALHAAKLDLEGSDEFACS